jgi:hypothetical protein
MSPDLPAPLTVVLGVIDVLEDLGARYHLGGSFASAVHGVPRQTLDADIVVELDQDRAAQLVATLKRDFYVDAGVAADAVSRRGSFNAIHLASGFKVDFFVMGNSKFDRNELDRSQLHQIVEEPARFAYVKTAEDTVLRKLQWFTDGGGVSDRQWRDVLGVILTGGNGLDRSYLREWADRLGLGRALEKALSEADAD